MQDELCRSQANQTEAKQDAAMLHASCSQMMGSLAHVYQQVKVGCRTVSGRGNILTAEGEITPRWKNKLAKIMKGNKIGKEGKLGEKNLEIRKDF